MDYQRHYNLLIDRAKNRLLEGYPEEKGLPGNFLGKEHNKETKNKMSIIAKSRPKVECPHCGKIGQHNAMQQHHFNRCNIREAV